jgi:hypothetical protein
MCTVVHERRAEYATQYELAKRLGVPVKRLPLLPGYPETALLGRVCLCPVDLDAALNRAGIAFTRDAVGDLIIHKS